MAPERAPRGDVAARFALAASPSPPRTRWAMVAVFGANFYTLMLWAEHWRVLGVGTFYLFYNGPRERLAEVEQVLAPLAASVVLVYWPVLVSWPAEPNERLRMRLILSFHGRAG